MNAPHAWTTLDLELYADDALPPESRERLSAALREDPALRERLAGVGRVDGLARRALETPPAASAPALRTGVPWRRVAALAACLALAALALKAALRAPVAPLDPATNRAPGTPWSRATPSAVRVVLSLPATAARGRASDAVPPADLTSALAVGDVDRAAAVIAAADGEARDAQYRALGEMIRSAAAAEQVLDRLSPAEQLEACRRWAEQPRLRPAAFARLDRLSRSPELAREFALVISTLAERPELQAWVRSYVRAAPAEPATKKS